MTTDPSFAAGAPAPDPVTPAVEPPATPPAAPADLRVRFQPDMMHYLGILVVNRLLTILTLSLYFPWARVAELKYLYQSTRFSGSNFIFSGTGKEIFWGYVRLVLIVAVLVSVYVGSFVLAQQTGIQFYFTGGLLFLLVAGFLIMPLALYGAYRYRLARSSWRGVQFTYTGERSSLVRIFGTYLARLLAFFVALAVVGFAMGSGGAENAFAYAGLFFLVYLFGGVAMGYYYAVFLTQLRREIASNVQMGNVKADYVGTATELFLIYLKGYFLTAITFGIYYLWFRRDLESYFWRHLQLEQNGRVFGVEVELKGEDWFAMLLVNGLLVGISFGLLLPIAKLRYWQFIVNRLMLDPGFDPNSVLQTEDNFSDATGGAILDAFDIPLI